MNSRRKVLLSLGAGSALSVWHRPVINSVVLPAHAQMTLCPDGITTGNLLVSPVSGVPTGEPERCSIQSTGPRITWNGAASDAPFCDDALPVDDVTFTATLSCDGMATEFTQDFTLSSVLP